MAKDRKKLVHIHSKITDKQPRPEALEVGEIAVNNGVSGSTDRSFLSIKNADNKVVRFSSDEQMIFWTEKKEVIPFEGQVRGEDGPESTKDSGDYGSYGITNNDLLNNKSNLVIKFNQVAASNTPKSEKINGGKDIYNKLVNGTPDASREGAGIAIDMSRYAMRGANPSFSSLTITNGTTLEGDLNVSGNTKIGNGLNVTGATNISGATKITGDTTFNGNETVNGNLTVTGNTNISGDTRIKKTLTVDGATKINNNLTVTGDTNISGNTRIDKNLTVSGNTNVSGSTTIKGDTNISGNTRIDKNLTVSGNTNVSGNTTIKGDTNISGNTTIDKNLTVNGDTKLQKLSATTANVTNLYATNNISGSSLSATTISGGSAVIGGDLNVSGNTTIKGDTNISGNTTIDKNLTVSGNTYISGDTVFGGEVEFKEPVTIELCDSLTSTTIADGICEAFTRGVVTIEKNANPDDTRLATVYTVKQNGQIVNTIEVAKDKVLKSAETVKVDNEWYIRLTWITFDPDTQTEVETTTDVSVASLVKDIDDKNPNGLTKETTYKNVVVDVWYENGQNWVSANTTSNIHASGNLIADGKLIVSGDTVLGGNLNVSGDTTLKKVTANTINVTSLTATSGNVTNLTATTISASTIVTPSGLSKSLKWSLGTPSADTTGYNGSADKTITIPSSLSHITSAHTHVSSAVTRLDGYSIATTAAEISSADTLNQALGKLQKSIDGKQGTLTAGRAIKIDSNNKISLDLPIYSGTGTNAIVENSTINDASGQYSHAEGYMTLASGSSAHAEGRDTRSYGAGSHAEGLATTANTKGSHAEGDSTIASGQASHAEGVDTVAIGYYSHAEGSGTTASGENSHAEGSLTKANGISSHAEGDSTQANGHYSHTEGSNTIASGISSHAEGAGTHANGDYSHAEGYVTYANNAGSHAEGRNTVATGTCAHAEGYQTTASGDYGSHAEGSGTTASGKYSHAEGESTIASGRYSHAEGSETLASDGCHAEGYQTISSGWCGHAEGHGTIAGQEAHAEGIFTVATNQPGTHAEGLSTSATNEASHAEGRFSQAKGTYSHAEGSWTLTTNDSEHASGRYNVSSSASTTFGHSGNTLFSVGNGSDTTRHNAFEIRQNGDTYVNGKLSVSGDVTANTFYATSDERLKENIENVSYAKIANAANVNIKSFNFKSDEEKKTVIGVIAQDVEKENLGFIVSTSNDGMKAVDYTGLSLLKIAYLEKKIKELENIINELKQNKQ